MSVRRLDPALRPPDGRWSRGLALAVVATAVVSVAGYATLGLLGLVLPFVALAAGRLLLSWPVDAAFPAIVAVSLLFENPGEQPYGLYWRSPTQGIGELWFNRNTLPLAPFVLAFLILFARVVVGRTGAHLGPPGPLQRALRPPRPYVTACVVSIGALVAFMTWGVLRGGSQPVAVSQFFPMMLLPVIGLTIAGSAHWQLLRRREQVIIWCSIAKAFMCIYAYLRLRSIGIEYVTTHSDSALWAVAVIILFSQWIHGSRADARRRLLLLAPLFGYALVANDRRIAWISLIVGTLVVLGAAPIRTKANLRKLTLVLAPFVIAYAVVGWVSPPSTVFSPVQAIKSASSPTDSSANSRDVEDLNLLYTLRANGPLGVGLGHEYQQVFGGDDLSALFDYKYYPHNSVLAAFAFGGFWAFPLYWLPVVMGVAYALSVGRPGPGIRAGPSPRAGAAAAWAIGAMLAYMLQGWADVGLQAPVAVIVGAVGCGVAGALPGLTVGGARAAPPPLVPGGVQV